MAANETVWVVYDGINEEVMGVFSAESLAMEYRAAYPSPSQLDVTAFVLDTGTAL